MLRPANDIIGRVFTELEHADVAFDLSTTASAQSQTALLPSVRSTQPETHILCTQNRWAICDITINNRDLLVIPPISLQFRTFSCFSCCFPNVVAPTEEPLQTGSLSPATPASIVANFYEQRLDCQRMS